MHVLSSEKEKHDDSCVFRLSKGNASGGRVTRAADAPGQRVKGKWAGRGPSGGTDEENLGQRRCTDPAGWGREQVQNHDGTKPFRNAGQLGMVWSS